MTAFLKTKNVYLFLPNIIGYVRIALLLIAFSTFQDNYVLSATCYIVSFLLDEVDGRVARYLGQTSMFGQQLDEMTDEFATTGLCFILSFLYPQYKWFFFLTFGLDFTAHWTFMYNSMLEGAKHHKEADIHPILTIYWTHPENIYCGYSVGAPQRSASNGYPQHMFSWRNKKNIYVLSLSWVYGNHVFLTMLYLCYFNEGAVLSAFGVSVGIIKLLAFLSGPWSITRTMINVLMLVSAFRSIACKDYNNRTDQGTNPPVTQQNGTMKYHDHQH